MGEAPCHNLRKRTQEEVPAETHRRVTDSLSTHRRPGPETAQRSPAWPRAQTGGQVTPTCRPTAGCWAGSARESPSRGPAPGSRRGQEARKRSRCPGRGAGLCSSTRTAGSGRLRRGPRPRRQGQHPQDTSWPSGASPPRPPGGAPLTTGHVLCSAAFGQTGSLSSVTGNFLWPHVFLKCTPT